MKTISNAALGCVAGMLLLSANAGAAGSAPKTVLHANPAKARPDTTWALGTCDWTPGDNTPMNASQAGNLRYGWVDMEAGYFAFVISPAYPTGTTFRVNGHYTDSRYMSFQLYAGNTVNLASMADFTIQPDAGSQTPATSINYYDRTIPYGGSYTIKIIVGPRPATIPPNTFYIDPSQYAAGQYPTFLYRTYNNYDNIPIWEFGGEALPTVVEETSNGDVPISQLARPGLCQMVLGTRNLERLTVAESLDFLEGLPQHPNPIPPTPVPPAPQFIIYYANTGTWLINDDNRYLYTSSVVSQKLGDLLVMRAKAPTYSGQPGVGNDPQVRHWSMCQNSQMSFETYQCIEDYQAAIDSDGFFNIVMSVPSKKPANATHAYGFDWLTWGTTTAGLPIFRHMLPSADFTQSAFAVPPGVDPQSIMGDYFPLATYCANSVFSAHTNNHETPAQVFAACQVGK